MFIAIAITSSVTNTGLVAKCAVYALGSIANQVGHFFHRLGDVLHKTPPASRLMIKEDEQLVPSETQPGLPSSYELIQDLSTADWAIQAQTSLRTQAMSSRKSKSTSSRRISFQLRVYVS